MDDCISRSRGSLMRRTLRLVLPALLLAAAVLGQAPAEQRNFDARIDQNARVNLSPTATQRAVEDVMRLHVPDLAVTYDRVSGVARNMRSHTGYLTGPSASADFQALYQDFANTYVDLMGLTASDISNYEVADVVYSQVTGATHVYLRQLYAGIPAFNAQMHMNVNREGRIISMNNAFIPDMEHVVNTRRPRISAARAVLQAAGHLGLQADLPQVLTAEQGAQQTTHLSAADLSLEDVTAKLFWLFVGPGETRMVWNFQIQTLDSQHWFDINVDAVTGKVWTRFDWATSGSYRVYEQPVESPEHTTPSPPQDARSLVINPEDATASPDGWFHAGTTIMDGNNVHACADTNANNSCDAGEPSCGGSLTCDFAINLSAAPSSSIPAAITNLFYWNNTIHDIQYKYGFDEAGGNFQENNFGRGGVGSDSVNADAQDGSGNCNANFATPGDGGNPRMQMFTCTNVSPARDGDYDAGVIVHEYGHGISNRQVGGPSTSGCLNNTQQAGEGWSDWFGLVYTAEAGDVGADARGIGSYLFGLNPNGGTIRDLPYSTNNAVNNWTYQSISGAGVPHGVGSRWAQAIWEVYWALVDKHGFDADLLNPGAFNGGNQRAMLYVNEGLKNTACGPTFIDNRDGIIQAATDNFGGADVCTLWDAFAGFGLGTNASTPGPNSTSATNGFDVPAACQGETPPTVTINSPANGTSVLQGTSISFAGTASDTQDGDLTANLSWSSNLDGPIGSGGSFSATLSLGTHTVTASVTDSSAMSGSDAISVTVFAAGGNFEAHFDAGTDGFSYVDDAFRGTNQPAFADGSFSATGGFAGGGLVVDVGGVDDADILNMSGGFRRPFSLSQSSNVSVSLRYNLTQTADYEADEFSQSLFSIDGTLVGTGANDFLAQLTGNGNGGGAQSTGFVQVTLNLGVLAPGSHTLTIGAFNNKKTLANEATEVRIDDVILTSTPTGGNVAPTVTINSPSNGSSFQDGTSINFSGTASDPEDGNLTANLSWSSNLDGTIGSGGSFSTTLSVGSHTVTASVTDSGGASGSDSISVTVTAAPPPPPPGGGAIDWNVTTTVSYSNQDASANVAVEDGGATLLLLDNTWRRTTDTFTVAANTVLEFDFQSTVQGEIHGIGFDENDNLNDSARQFQLFGSQNWTGVGRVQTFAGANTYTGSGAFEPFQINVGAFYTGAGMRLVLINDNDAGLGNDSRFRNVQVRQCTSIDDFESGAEGWTNSGASTCSTGSFIVGSPTEVVASGVRTQLAGDHSSGSGNAFFSAVNTAAGTNDVDGGTCIVTSPVHNVAANSDVSIWYYHGQRDAGDDAGDFFELEASINGGAFATLASFGDVAVNAAWQKASISVSAGQSVQFRVRVADGPGNGDLIEAGVDDIVICPQ